MSLATSKAFWAALIALIVIVIAAFVPGFEMDEARAVEFAVIAAAYIIGVSVDPGSRSGWQGVLKSRKFWAAVVGFIVVFLRGFQIELPLGITEDQLVGVIVLIIGSIMGAASEVYRPGPAAS